MDDEERNIDESGTSTRGGASRRGGLGDDQGTRVGSPDAASTGAAEREGQRGHAGPSTQPVQEGLEGAILDDDQNGRDQ